MMATVGAGGITRGRAIPMQRIDLGEGAWLQHWPRVLGGDGGAWMTRLADELAWHEESYSMFGRTVTAPRLVAWHGDRAASYRYSGVVHDPQPWTAALEELRALLRAECGLDFNAVLANWYRHGQDGMGWHSDREREIGPSADDRQIASLSVGAPRRFLLRHEASKEVREFRVGDGDLLIMRGTTQDHFKHSVPKTAKPVGPRINLSYRTIVPAGVS